MPFESSFVVGEPSASVMNEDLNIIYRDFDNRYVVSAPGMTDNQLKVSVVGADVHRQGKFYILRPKADAKQVKVTVLADMNGRTATMGEKVFKVQKLPQPSPYFMDNGKQVDANKTARKSLNKGTLLEIGYGEDGLLEVGFEVTSFDTYILRKTAKSSGNKFSAAQLKQIGQLKSGDLVLVQNIKYRTKGGAETLFNGNLTLMLK
jgi:gliding motility-associated protein GldM